MMRGIRLVTACMALAFLAGARADGALINWTANGGASDFDADDITFAPIISNQITAITGGGYFHTHASPTTAFIDVRLDGVWTQIFSTSTSGEGPPFSTFAPISFATGSVDGIRFRADNNWNQTFHNFTGETFNFAEVAAIPEPSSLALLGASAVGLIAARRRKQGEQQAA